MKSLLIITRQPPWAGTAAREALDIALAGGAFDLPVSLLFLDDGVFQLNARDPRRLEQKNLSANLQALSLFGIERCYVSARALQRRGLQVEDSQLTVDVIDDDAIRALISSHDQVMTL